MLDHLIPLHRQYQDVVVHPIKFLVLPRPHLRVDVPKQDQILEDDDVRNTDVQLELRPVIVSLVFYLFFDLGDDVFEVGALEDALAGPADLGQTALSHIVATEELILSRQVQQRWQDFDIERVITEDLGLLEAIDPKDALHAESVLLEELLEECPGTLQIVVCLLVAPEFLWELVVLILHYYIFFYIQQKASHVHDSCIQSHRQLSYRMSKLSMLKFFTFMIFSGWYHQWVQIYWKLQRQDMSVFQTGKMTYRNLGNSGLKTSVISLGNWINSKEENYAIDEEIIRVALANGINHIDTAQVYDDGKAETQLGKILKNLKVEREDIIVATKMRKTPESDINSDHLLSKKHIKEGLNGCLKRLQLDYVDIIYAHFYDDCTPLEQVCRAFHEIIQDGKAFYWATSNWDAESVFEALAICERLNLHKPIGSQSQYNMLVRAENQVEYLNLYQKYNYGLVGWSPLAGGFLTGKYLNGISEQEVHRFNDPKSPLPVSIMKDLFYDKNATEQNNSAIKQLSELADKQFGASLAQLAVAWVIKYQYTSSALVGARNAAQLQDTLKALDLIEKWTPEIQGKINKILGTTPTPRMDFRAWKPSDPIRPVAQ